MKLEIWNFFNEGNANGSELLRQFLHVTMCLSLVDIITAGLTLDASGPNRWFVRLLLLGNNKVVGGTIEHVSFRNVFFDKLCWIFI